MIPNRGQETMTSETRYAMVAAFVAASTSLRGMSGDASDASRSATTDGLLIAAIATALFTAVLAWVTWRLVVSTKAMATASKLMVTVTQDLAPQPAIVPNLFIYADNVFLDLHNAGDGAALDVDVTITWKRRENAVTVLTSSDTRWRASIIPAGKRVRFNPKVGGAGWLTVKALGVLDSVSVVGTMKNARGEVIAVHGSIEQPGELHAFEVESQRQYPSNYEPEEIVAAATKKIADIVEQRLRP